MIEKDEDGMFVGRVPQLKGCVTQAKSIEELMLRLKDAVELCLEEQSDSLNEVIEVRQIEVA